MAFDAEGYEIRHSFTSYKKSLYSVFTPDGKHLRDFRHEDGAHGAASRHFVQSKPTTKKKCMNCPTIINSTGFGHRLCGPCSTQTAGMD